MNKEKQQLINCLRRQDPPHKVAVHLSFDDKEGWKSVQKLREAGLEPLTTPIDIMQAELNIAGFPLPRLLLFCGPQEINQFLEVWRKTK